MGTHLLMLKVEQDVDYQRRRYGLAAMVATMSRGTDTESGARCPSPRRSMSGCEIDKRPLREGRTYLETENVLGKGLSAVVREAKDVNGKSVAGKTFEDVIRAPLNWTKRERARDVLQEAKFLACLNHPNVISLLDLKICNDTGDVILVMENGGEDLQHWIDSGEIGKLPLEEKYSIIHQLLDVLSYFAANKILHRDLKPQNILLMKSDGKYIVKVIDFGFCITEEIAKHELIRKSGTVQFMAPERLREELLGEELLRTKVWSQQPGEVWSMGLIITEILTGKRPFSECFPCYVKVNGKRETERDYRKKCGIDIFSELVNDYFKEDHFQEYMKFRRPTEARMIDEYDGMNDYMFDILNGMLHPNPEQRTSADTALKRFKQFIIDDVEICPLVKQICPSVGHEIPVGHEIARFRWVTKLWDKDNKLPSLVEFRNQFRELKESLDSRTGFAT